MKPNSVKPIVIERDEQRKKSLADHLGCIARSDNFYALLTIAALLFGAYLPFTQGYFLMNDDYWGYAYDYTKYRDHPLFHDTAVTIGRPLCAYLLALAHSCISTVSSANIIRGINISLLALIGFQFYLWLTLNHIGKKTACLLSVLLLTLPPFHYFVSGVAGIVNVISVLFAVSSAFLAYKESPETAISRSLMLRFLLAIGLFFTSLIIYPVSTMFYWVMVAVVIVRINYTDFLELKRHLYLLLLTPFIALCGYFIFFKLIQDISPATELSTSLPDRLIWFVRQPLVGALNLWEIDADGSIFWEGGIVILIGLVLAVNREIFSKPQKATKLSYAAFILEKWLLLIFLFPVSILPILVTSNYVLSYRHLVALSPLILLALVWSIKQIAISVPLIKRTFLLPTGLAIICLYGIWNAHNNGLNHIVVPMSAELKYFKKILSQHNPADIKRVHVLVSTKFYRTHLTTTIKNQPYEEFPGFQSTLIAPYAGAFNSALVMTAIKELAREDKRFAAVRKDWTIGRAVDVVSYSTKEDMEKQKIVFDLKNTVVIDMTQIEFLVDSGILPENERLTASAKSAATPIAKLDQCTGGTAISGGDYPGFPALLAFDDDSLGTRWTSKQTGLENSGVAYIGYDFGNGVKKHIRQLHLRQGGAITSVKVQQSDDGSLWRDVVTLALQADNNTYLHDLPPSQAARFWRLLANGNTGEGPSAWSVYEIEMMEFAQ